jgi:hypothetical protein
MLKTHCNWFRCHYEFIYEKKYYVINIINYDLGNFIWISFFVYCLFQFIFVWLINFLYIIFQSLQIVHSQFVYYITASCVGRYDWKKKGNSDKVPKIIIDDINDIIFFFIYKFIMEKLWCNTQTENAQFAMIGI